MLRLRKHSTHRCDTLQISKAVVLLPLLCRSIMYIVALTQTDKHLRNFADLGDQYSENQRRNILPWESIILHHFRSVSVFTFACVVLLSISR